MTSRPSGAEEILINVTPQETRVALIEQGLVQELLHERTARRGHVGNVYRGRVTRVLPGMQSAFVDIGDRRAAFLPLADVRLAPDGRRPESIQGALHEGQSITVQVIKDALGSKGARLTMDVSLASRFLVYLPYGDQVGVSQKIEDEGLRSRLRQLVQILQTEIFGPEAGGVIVRTVAESADDAALSQDLQFLHRLWQHLKSRIPTTEGPQLLYEEPPLLLRTLRDGLNDQVKQVLVDSRESVQRARAFIDIFMPERASALTLYTGERPLFDRYHVEEDIQRALQRKVPLKCGGYLVIDQTEAMTTVDVNTGSYVGTRNLEDTVFRTNLEATHVIARQLRLRNLGGIVIIDFIDMALEDHRQQVMRAFEKMLARDPARTQITQVSALGLVEMTRKRVRESLSQVLCEPCPVCAGRGILKTPETVCFEIFRDVLRAARAFESANSLCVVASQGVIDRLLAEESAAVADLEQFIGRPIRLQVSASYTQEQFDVVLA